MKQQRKYIFISHPIAKTYDKRDAIHRAQNEKTKKASPKWTTPFLSCLDTFLQYELRTD